jgi:hypothetical protein
VIEILHGGMLVPTSVSLCCAFGSARRDRVMGVVVGLAMLLAMADFVVRTQVLPTIVWGAILLLLALVVSAHASVRNRARPAVGTLVMAAHRGLGLVLMAASLVLAGPSAGIVTTGAHTHASSGPAFVVLLGGATLAYAGFAAVAIARRLHGGQAGGGRRGWLRDGSLDLAAMTVAAVLMSVMVVVPAGS